MLQQAIAAFSKDTLRPTTTVDKSVGDALDSGHAIEPPPTCWVKTAEGWREVAASVAASQTGAASATRVMAGAPHELHGQCYGFETERNKWAPPSCTFASEAAARPGYDTRDASEYQDTAEVLLAKVRQLATLVRKSRRFVVYAGAGLSTAAGIDDYATQSGGSSKGFPSRSPLCAQLTLAHRVLVGLYGAGHLHRLIQRMCKRLERMAMLAPLHTRSRAACLRTCQCAACPCVTHACPLSGQWPYATLGHILYSAIYSTCVPTEWSAICLTRCTRAACFARREPRWSATEGGDAAAHAE